jgi:hypothetical protein
VALLVLAWTAAYAIRRAVFVEDGSAGVGAAAEAASGRASGVRGMGTHCQRAAGRWRAKPSMSPLCAPCLASRSTAVKRAAGPFFLSLTVAPGLHAERISRKTYPTPFAFPRPLLPSPLLPSGDPFCLPFAFPDPFCLPPLHPPPFVHRLQSCPWQTVRWPSPMSGHLTGFPRKIRGLLT